VLQNVRKLVTSQYSHRSMWGMEKRSVHFEEAMYTERNVAMYSDSKQDRK